MHDPSRSQLGNAQRDWLFGALDGSDATWRLLANSSVMGQTWSPGISEDLRPGLRALKLISADASPDPDQWDGYPVERDLLLQHLGGGNSVVLSGDVHVALALELRRDGAEPGSAPLAAEFVTASLTSQNLDDKKGWGYRVGSLPTERALMDLLPGVRWCDLDSHGYMIVDVTPETVTAEWWFVDGVLAPTSSERLGRRALVHRGDPTIQFDDASAA
jgi:alkaline phosphatase D